LNKAHVRFEQALFEIVKGLEILPFARSKRTGSEQATAPVRRLLAHSDGQKWSLRSFNLAGIDRRLEGAIERHPDFGGSIPLLPRACREEFHLTT
jgi:hypothetical protein